MKTRNGIETLIKNKIIKEKKSPVALPINSRNFNNYYQPGSYKEEAMN